MICIYTRQFVVSVDWSRVIVWEDKLEVVDLGLY